MRTIKLDDIRIDGGTQFRDQINQDVVKEYKQAMLDGAEFPPMQCTFDGTDYWLWDGFHRYFAIKSIGVKSAEIEYRPGTQEDAQDLALSANAHHGHNRNNETKRRQVEAALAMPRHAEKSNRELAKLCQVSDKFVAAIRSPEAKEKQESNRKSSNEKKYGGSKEEQCDPIAPVDKLTDSNADPKPSLTQDYGPSAEELEAMEIMEQEDRAAMHALLEADDKLAHLEAENKKLRHLTVKLEMRINALMVEKNEAIKDAKAAQRQLDKINKAKK